ncbi:MAG: DnaJ domain-containing protein [Myxococcales bacterium]|nr:DnaJ domain-containing protein [Myxococcales bacterium]
MDQSDYVSRRETRHPVSLFALVATTSEDSWTPAYINDISPSGAFVKTSEAPPLGGEIRIRIPQLAVGSEACISGVVRHHVEETEIFLRGLSAGIGVEFTDVPAEIGQYLNIYIDSFDTSDADKDLESEIYDAIVLARRAEVFGLLGLDEDSTVEQLVNKFQEWSKRFRPNRFVGRVSADHLHALNRLYSRISTFVDWMIKSDIPELAMEAAEVSVDESSIESDWAEISRLRDGHLSVDEPTGPARMEEPPAPERESGALWGSNDEMLDYVRSLTAVIRDVNFFELLGVRPDSERGEIDTAYRWRLRQFHPDHYPQIEGPDRESLWTITVQVNEAYAALRDTQRRRAYADTMLQRESER